VAVALLSGVSLAHAVDVALGSVTAGPGSSVAIPLSAATVTGLDLIGVDAAITYDASALTATGVDANGTLLDGWLSSTHVTVDGTTGAMNVAMSNGVAAVGAGVLVYVLFDVDTSAAGDVALVLNVRLNEGRIPTSAMAGSVTVAAATPTFVQRNSWIFEPSAESRNGQADAGERIQPRVRLKNEGAADARNVSVTLTLSDPDVTVVKAAVTHDTWPVGMARNNVGLELSISPDAATHDALVTVNVTADNGGPWQFTFMFPVVGAPPAPDLALRSVWVRDRDTGNDDSVANPGERLELRVRLRNDGDAEAVNVAVSLTTQDPDVSIVDGRVEHATWPIGEARNNVGLALDIGPTASGSVALTVTVTADSGGPWMFPYALPVIAPPRFVERSFWVRDKVTGDADGLTEPGERVETRVRVKNAGPVDAEDVVVTLRSASPHIEITSAPTTYGSWAAGAARTVPGIAVIGPDAVGDVAVTVEVVASNGGPWEFAYTIAVAPVAEMVSRSFWARDKVTGDGDGEADGGERIELRARLKNVGAVAAENVTVTLTTTTSGVDIVAGVLTYATWPVGEARNNVGLLVDIGSGVTEAVSFTLTVEADNGGPWELAYSLPVTPMPLGMVLRNAWGRDKTTGNANGSLNPDERIEVRTRLKNEGITSLENVVVTLVSVDGQASVQKESVLHASWPAGEARTNVGHTAVISADASGSADFRIDVTADNGGPWQFPFTLPITPSPATFAYRNAWARDKTTGDGDGLAEPGERVELRVRLKNDGQVDAGVVTVTLSSEDVNVTVVDSKVTHSTWPGGLARNNAGFTVDLGESVGPSVAFAVDVMTDGGSWEFAFAVPIAAPAAPSALRKPEDIDRDGAVGLTDIVAFAPLFGASAASRPGADLNGDGVLDFADMVVIHVARSDLGSMAPAAAPSALSQTQAWIDEARARDDGSVVYQRGLPALERILRAMTPAATALLPNYPNPFNPETWIPFDIAEDADATVRIYDVTGSLVRRLDLGRLPPGSYRSRGDAAYWDGLNGAGERVASGVYVYELQAGSVRRARRMVVRK